MTVLSARLFAAADRLADLAAGGAADVLTEPLVVAGLQFLLKELGTEAAFHEDDDVHHTPDVYCDDELLAGALADAILNGVSTP